MKLLMCHHTSMSNVVPPLHGVVISSAALNQLQDHVPAQQRDTAAAGSETAAPTLR